VPFVAVSYDPKVDASAASVGQPVAATTRDAVRADELVRAVRRQAKIDRAFRAAVAELADRAERPADAVISALRRRET